MYDSSVKKIELQIDLVCLRHTLADIIKKYPLSESNRQICFTSNKSSGQSVYDGAGSIYDYKKSVWLSQEKDFKYFIDEFRGSYLELIYNQMQDYLNNQVARMRLMYLPPKTCYSFHYDMTVRYHLSLETNPSAFLIFKEEPPVHIPSDGHFYYVDTRNWHTAVNAGEESRVHLVLSVFNENAEIKKLT